MWREPAIRSLLMEEICNLPRVEPSESDLEDRAESDRLLKKAVGRGRLVVGLDWLILLVLFCLRTPGQTWLAFGPTEGSVFTIAILIVAVHSGFRLGQLEKLQSTRRALDDLEQQADRS